MCFDVLGLLFFLKTFLMVEENELKEGRQAD